MKHFAIFMQKGIVVSASSLGLRGCLSGCTSKICQPLLIGFWVPFLLLETSKSFKDLVQPLDNPMSFLTVVFVLTGWRSYQSRKATNMSLDSVHSAHLSFIQYQYVLEDLVLQFRRFYIAMASLHLLWRVMADGSLCRTDLLHW